MTGGSLIEIVISNEGADKFERMIASQIDDFTETNTSKIPKFARIFMSEKVKTDPQKFRSKHKKQSS